MMINNENEPVMLGLQQKRKCPEFTHVLSDILQLYNHITCS